MSATTDQRPGERNWISVAGDIFAFQVNVTATDGNGDPIDWADITAPFVDVTDRAGSIVASLAPTVTSPSSGVLHVEWTGDQTAAIGQFARWDLGASFGGVVGHVIAGSLSFTPGSFPGASDDLTVDLVVNVGQVTVNLAVQTAGSDNGGGGGGGGGSVDSVTAGDSTLTAGGTSTNPTLKVTPNTFDAHGAASTAQTAAQSFATAADTVIAGTVTAEASTRGTADTNLAAAIVTAQSAAETFASNALSSALAGLSAAEFPADAQGSGLTHSGVGQTVGGVVVTAGMRILDTAGAVSSGLWVAASGAWTRPADFAAGSNAQGKLVEVDNGALWLCVASGTITVGTTAQVWTQLDASIIQAGAGLTKTGSTIALALTRAIIIATGLTPADIGAATATALTNEVARAGTAEGLLAPKASPALTGTPTAPTPSTSDSSTKLATTAFAQALLAAISGDASVTAGVLSLLATSNVESIIRSQPTNLLTPPTAAVPGGGQRYSGLGTPSAIGDAMPLWNYDGTTWTRVSNTQFTIASVNDLTPFYAKGTALKWQESGGTQKYGVVASSSFAGSTVTVNLIPTTDFVMTANADAATNGYSYVPHPPGFPTSFAWTPTVTGFGAGAGPTLPTSCWWSLNGGLITVSFAWFGAGTSNAGTFTITNAPLPFAGTTVSAAGPCVVTDSGTQGPGLMSIVGSVITLTKAAGTATFASTGNKNASGAITYPF